MKKLLLLLLVFPGHFNCQIPPGYYNSAQGLTDQNLFVALHNIIKNHNVISYSALWTAFPKTDRKTNGKVWDIYSYKPVGTQPYEYTFVSNQCGSYNSEGDCYNREHSWPQSWFNGVSGPDSDLFHLYPTDGYVNNQRGNFPFGEVNSPSWTSQNGGKLGPCVSAGYGGTVFEPIDEFKGDLARSYFYMTVRYYTEDAGWSSSAATNKSSIVLWQLSQLLTWHLQDPVSAKEIARNDSIYKIQNNRNPFIDHPDFADSIWLSPNGLFEDALRQLSSFSVYPNPAESFFYLNSTLPLNSEVKLSIEDVTGKVIVSENKKIEEETKVDCSHLEQGIYFISISDRNFSTRLKFIKTQ